MKRNPNTKATNAFGLFDTAGRALTVAADGRGDSYAGDGGFRVAWTL